MKMRILGLTLMAFFLFNSAALIAGTHGNMVSSYASVKGNTGPMNDVATNKNFTPSSGGDDSDSTSGDGDSNSTVDDVTGDLLDGFF